MSVCIPQWQVHGQSSCWPMDVWGSQPQSQPLSPQLQQLDNLNRKVQPKILLKSVDVRICYTVDLASDFLSSLHEWKGGATEVEMSSPWISAWGGGQAKRDSRCHRF